MSDKVETSTLPSSLSNDEIYLRIWEKHQDQIHLRWNSITIFLTISFALFGLSLQNTNLPVSGTVQRITAIAIYWFSYLIYRRYSDYSHFLRAYLEDLETTMSFRIALQHKWKKYHQGYVKWISLNKLLIYFGALYTASVVVLWWLKIP